MNCSPEEEGDEGANISATDAYSDEATVVVVHFDAHVTGAAVEGARRADYCAGAADEETFFSR